MIELSEPQVWTLIGVFAAALFGMLTLMSTMFVRIINARFDGLQAQMLAEINGLRHEMLGEINGLHGGLNGLRAEMNARFEKVESQIAHLDRDVQALAKRVFPD